MRRRDLDAHRRETARLLDQIDRRVEGIHLVTIVREPGSQIAADAYDGLRRQIGAALGERNAHLHQLAQFDAAFRAGATPEELERLVREWMGQARLAVSFDTSRLGAFEEVGDPHGKHVRVVAPAYIDETTDRVVRSGVIERLRQPASPEPVVQEPEPEPVEVAATEPNGEAS